MARISALLERSVHFFIINAVMSAYLVLPLKLSGTNLVAMPMEDQLAYPLYSATRALVLALTLVFCAWSPGRVLAAAARAPLMNLFLLFAVLSIGWSTAPMVSLRRVIMLASTVAYAYYLVGTGRIQSTVRTIGIAAAMAGIASAIVALGAPDLGVMSDSESPELIGAWCGVFVHKNVLGMNMLVGAQACTWMALMEPKRRWPAVLGALICAAVTFGSRSRTAEIGLVASLPLFAALRLLRLPGLALLWTGLAISMLLALGALAIYIDAPAIMGAVGKDASMTGRLPLWSELVDAVIERPLHGYGYMGFFVEGNARMEAIQRATGWIAPEAHQGYLDIILQLGVPGLLLAVSVLVSATIRTLVAVRVGLPAWASFAVVSLIICFWTSTAESVLWGPFNVYSVLLPLAYAGVRMERAAQPLPAPSSAAFPTGRAGQAASDTPLLTNSRASADVAR